MMKVRGAKAPPFYAYLHEIKSDETHVMLCALSKKDAKAPDRSFLKLPQKSQKMKKEG